MLTPFNIILNDTYRNYYFYEGIWAFSSTSSYDFLLYLIHRSIWTFVGFLRLNQLFFLHFYDNETPLIRCMEANSTYQLLKNDIVSVRFIGINIISIYYALKIYFLWSMYSSKSCMKICLPRVHKSCMLSILIIM